MAGLIHEQAHEDYLAGMKYTAIADKYNVSINTVKSWKTRYNWDRKSVHTKQEKVCTQKRRTQKVSKSEPAAEEPVSELTEKQRLFCLYYVKSFNATMAAIKAGYAKERAHVTGSELVRKGKVREEIMRLKGKLREELFVDAMDVLERYIKIAFADMTDYVTFGQKEVPVIGMFGPIKDEDGNEVMQTVNYLDFNSSAEVDGGLICEIKQGKQGMSLKLEDRQKALDKLAEYFDLFPDKFKRRIEEERLTMDRKKAEVDKDEAKNVNVIFNIPRPPKGDVNA